MSSISSVTSPAVLKPVDASEPKGPDVKVDNHADNARSASPPVQAALPPGQGTRINIFA